MKNLSLKEFRPTIIFLVKFIGLYLIGNFLYGIYVTSYEPNPDTITSVVADQTGYLITACGWPVTILNHGRKPTSLLYYEGRPVISVYEGCNGVNTMIIFLAFIFAFGPMSKKLFWFIPLGMVIIHLFNLGRISLLFFITQYRPDFMYFVHKFIFTGILYVVVFLLWIWWVRKVALITPDK